MQQAAPQTFDRVLSSMCTEPHPAAREAAEEFLATNPGDAGAYCHVDAAWGGFLLPFTDHAWNFADAPIDSLTIDPPQVRPGGGPRGWVAVPRRRRDGRTRGRYAVPGVAVAGVACGDQKRRGVASTVAAIDALWPDGYRTEYERADRAARWLADELRGWGCSYCRL